MPAPPLFHTLADSLERQIRQGVYKPGDKLPSLRELSALRHYSKNTVIAAFEILVARGLVEPRHGSGFFVKGTTCAASSSAQDAGLMHRAMDIVWLMRMQLRNDPGVLAVGDAFPPTEWLSGARLDKPHHKVARSGLGSLFRYGDRLGYAPLRNQLVRQLAHIGIDASAQQILLTQGANQAMDLLVRYFVPPGEAVLIDDPGYYPLLGKLHLAGAQIVGVPRTMDGPDVQALEHLLKAVRPRIFFTQSLMHNPTGSDISQAKARAVLRLAHQHNLLVVENDVLGDFQSAAQTRMSVLDQLERTIYIGSFSKSLSAALRVGFLACSTDLADELANLKMLLSVGSSEYAERTVEAILAERRHSRYLEQLRTRLGDVTSKAYDLLDAMGADIYVRPSHSLYLWVRWPHFADARVLAEALLERKIIMAPGHIFSVNSKQSSPWSRCNPDALLHPLFRKEMDLLAQTLR